MPLTLESYLQGLTRFGIRPGLKRVRALLKAASLDNLSFPIILVGGTNGKGSTCEFLARLLACDGRKAGLFTSPHLYSYHERIRILPSAKKQLFEGTISPQAAHHLLKAAMPFVDTVAAQMHDPTEFETLVLLALLHFTRQKVDAAVLEVGLGGKLDATNVTDPLVSVLTHVDLDHQDRLGNTRQEIAADKVQIARPGHILICAEKRPEVLEVLLGYCTRKKVLFRPWRAPDLATDQSWKPLPPGPIREDDYQSINRQTALEARAAFYESIGNPAITPAPTANLSQVPGRYEVLQQSPLLIVDGANNPDGAAHLAQRISQDVQQVKGRKVLLVLGILKDKNYQQMLDILLPLADKLIFTQSHSPRAASARELAAYAQEKGYPAAIQTPVTSAVQSALEQANQKDMIVVAGSFYTLGEIDRKKI